MSNPELPKLFFATHSQYKTEEVGSMLRGIYEVFNLYDLDLRDEIPETGSSLEENSRIKANFLSHKFGINCFADDTGLEVDILEGAPGVLSARYAGEPKNDGKNVDLLLQNLSKETRRNARFRTVITLILDEVEKQFEGSVSGSIITERRGSDGFGYDPVFVPDGYTKTFAEMTPTEKNMISHRGIAVKKLIEFLRKS